MSCHVLHVRALSEEEDAQLRCLADESLNGRVVRRVQALRLSAGGLSPHQVTRLLGRSWSGVRKTINRVNREGMSSLSDEPGRGRRHKVTHRYVALLKEVMRRSPQDSGYALNAWTLDRLREHLALRTRLILSLVNRVQGNCGPVKQQACSADGLKLCREERTRVS